MFHVICESESAIANTARYGIISFCSEVQHYGTQH